VGDAYPTRAMALSERALRLRSASPVLSLPKGSGRNEVGKVVEKFPFVLSVAAAAAKSKHGTEP
jgi:hypothetical protein